MSTWNVQLNTHTPVSNFNDESCHYPVTPQVNVNAQEVHFLTLFNAQGEKLYFLDCYYLKGSVRMSCIVETNKSS